MCFQCSRQDVIEGEQPVTVLDQLGDHLIILDTVGFDEEIESGTGGLFRLSHSDVLEIRLRFLMEGFRHRDQHIGCL